MKVNQHLSWEEDVANVLKSSCMLQSLKYPIQAKKKTLAEALILSKIDHDSVVYQNVLKFLIKRLQKVQTISSGYVLNRYAKECE